MPTFSYKASTNTGKIIEDVIQSEDKTKAIHELQKFNYIVLSIKEKKDSFIQRHLKFEPYVPFLQKVIFFKHLSSMLEAGLTIFESIDTLSQQTSNKNLQKILKETESNLQNGLSLHYSLGKYPHIFSSLALSMVQTGEATGNLSETLIYLADQMEKTYDTRRKIIGAFIYPAVVMSLTLVLVTFLLIFAIPKITEILSTFNTELPTSTKVIIQISKILQTYYTEIFLGILACVILGRIILRRGTFKPIVDKLQLEMPLFGDLFKKSNIAMLTRTFASLSQSGVPIIQALHITADSLSNYHYKKAIIEAANKVEQGGTFAESLQYYVGLFPPIVIKMITVGEKIGNLDKTTLHLSMLYEKEVDQAVKNLSTLLEPLLLMGMGLIVGGIAVSIISPIYEISSSAMG